MSSIKHHFPIEQNHHPKQSIEPEKLRSLLIELIPYLEQQELIPSALSNTLSELSRTDEQITQLFKLVDNFDHEKALNMAQKLLKQI